LPDAANYPKTSLSGLTLAKPLGQFRDLQRNIHQRITKTMVLVAGPKNKPYQFSATRRKSSIVGQTTDIGVALDFATRREL
jgi:hypothetical protein